MDRKRFLALGAAALAGLASLGLSPVRKRRLHRAWAERREARMLDPRPNVLIVLTDDQPAHTVEHMPELQSRLVSKGLSFSRAYVSSPVCANSRATMFSGKHSHNTGIKDNAGAARKMRDRGLMRDTYATRLQGAGYRTGLFGKFQNGYGDVPDWAPPGFSRWFAHAGPAGDGRYFMNQDGTLKEFGKDRTLLAAERTEAFIRNSAEMGLPWMAIASLDAPHSPYDPLPAHAHDFDGVPLPWTPSFDEADVSDKPGFVRRTPRLTGTEKKEMKSIYEGKLEELQMVDDAIVRFDRALEETSQLGNTVVVYLTDNGWLLGEHRLSEKGKVYEEAVRTPLYVRGPGIPQGDERDALVSNVDLAATVCALAGVNPPGGHDGRSLVPLFADAGAQWRDALLIEWLGMREYGGSLWSAVQTARHAYAEHDTGDLELYDTDADPYQTESLHADPANASLMTDLSERLGELKVCTGDSCRAADNSPAGRTPETTL